MQLLQPAVKIEQPLVGFRNPDHQAMTCSLLKWSTVEVYASDSMLLPAVGGACSGRARRLSGIWE